MLAILLFTLLSAKIHCISLVLVCNLPVTRWGHCNISENTKLVNSQSLLLTTGLYGENTLCLHSSFCWVCSCEGTRRASDWICTLRGAC